MFDVVSSQAKSVHFTSDVSLPVPAHAADFRSDYVDTVQATTQLGAVINFFPWGGLICLDFSLEDAATPALLDDLSKMFESLVLATGKALLLTHEGARPEDVRVRIAQGLEGVEAVYS